MGAQVNTVMSFLQTLACRDCARARVRSDAILALGFQIEVYRISVLFLIS